MSNEDQSVVSGITPMTNKSIQREELTHIRKVRELMKKDQLVEVTTLDTSKLNVGSGKDDVSLSGSDRTGAGLSVDKGEVHEEEEMHEEEEEEDHERDVAEEEEEASGTRRADANNMYGSSSNDTNKGGGSGEERATHAGRSGLPSAPSGGANAGDQMAAGDG